MTIYSNTALPVLDFRLDDFPIPLSRLMKERSQQVIECLSEISVDTDRGGQCYGADSEVPIDDFQLQWLAACEKPIWLEFNGWKWSPNGGSHRLVFEAVQSGQTFVVAVEKIERFSCYMSDGDLVTVGAYSNTGDQMLTNGGIEFVNGLMKGMITSATNQSAVWDAYIPVAGTAADDPALVFSAGTNLEPRLRIRYRAPQEILSQSCQSSAEASACAGRNVSQFMNWLWDRIADE